LEVVVVEAFLLAPEGVTEPGVWADAAEFIGAIGWFIIPTLLPITLSRRFTVIRHYESAGSSDPAFHC